MHKSLIIYGQQQQHAFLMAAVNKAILNTLWAVMFAFTRSIDCKVLMDTRTITTE